MSIKHRPHFNTDGVSKYYTERDGVEVKYVCTTDLTASDVPVDVYYRATPHPEFGNRYFGLYWDNYRDAAMICNADLVEGYRLDMVKNDDGDYEYSQSHHDYKKFKNGNMIDGGRLYTKTSHGIDASYEVINGELVPVDLRTIMQEAQDLYEGNSTDDRT